MLGGVGMKKLFLLKMLDEAGIRKTPFNLLGEADIKELFPINVLGGADTKCQKDWYRKSLFNSIC